ncbi:uncharacterized protein LOC117811513 isoform X2 [Notolabrus celidotus]|uniref:uncharacterized protein LOC117811513 isoform X2 n=1 Tax=Notolabrus celidotus TaxID=1203425 RepID=UPI00148F8517|nr:uncharacterized protein LOC117811513 isoform X2 [Notolabrus celidotus]
MPRGKSYRRSLAAKKRMAEQRSAGVERFNASPYGSSNASARHGTGYRHPVQKWPVSSLSGKQHKLVFMPESPDKKFVLLVGDSHLRAIADRHVSMPEGRFSFGIMSTPGGAAHDLRAELVHAHVPRTPDAVCLLAPSNNLTHSRTISDAGADFTELLNAACNRWSNVVVVDFPPRFNCDQQYQELLRQEFHRVCVRLGVRYFPTACHFPLENTDLWARDGIHLSEPEGMSVLSQLMWQAVYVTLDTVPQPPAVKAPLRPLAPCIKPKLVVKGEDTPPRPPVNPFVWRTVQRGKEGNSSGEPGRSSGVLPQRRKVQKQVVKECTIPLNPVWFSFALLDEMDKLVPSHLPGTAVPEGKQKAFVERRRSAASKRSRSDRQAEAVPSVVVVKARVTSTTFMRETAEAEEAVPSVVGASPESPVQSPDQAAPVEGPARPHRTQRPVKGQSVAAPVCMCSEQLPPPLVSGSSFVGQYSDVNTLLTCSAVAAIKHTIAPVCTWRGRDIDEVRSEGTKLVEFLVEESKKVPAGERELCTLIEKHTVFGGKWNVDIGRPEYFVVKPPGEDTLVSEKLQDLLLRDGMCLFGVDGLATAVIQHKDYIVVVDCSTRDASGSDPSCSRSVAVFNTCLNDLMFHIRGLQKSFNAQAYVVASMSVKPLDVGLGVETVSEVADSDGDMQVTGEVQESSSVRSACHVRSVQGTFHQGDDQFEFGGFQCMAISLVGMAKHTTDSVFSWQSKTLDDVVVSGDKLYASLRKNNLISDKVSLFLCVPDLPKQHVVDGQSFDFEYGDFVSGLVGVDDGPTIELGVHVSLKRGLTDMFTQYDTCLLTVQGSTCAIVHQGGRYAVVDSHARSAEGMLHGNGRSVVVYFSCIDQVYDHICKLSRMLPVGVKQFEIAGVRVSLPGLVVDSDKSLGQSLTVESRKSVFGSSVSEVSSGQPAVSCSSSVRAEKRKRSAGCFLSKKWKRSDDTDVVFVSDVASKGLQFNPLRREVSEALCKQLNVESEIVDAVSSEVGQLGVPCKNESIQGDGNCFFRAVSQAVSGTQKNHRKVRLAVVKQMESNVAKYKSLLRSEFSSVAEYLRESKMQYVGRWATEVEIQAAADCLGVSIFTYHQGRWLEYSCRNRQFSNQGVYLEHCNDNHYETVVCVQQPLIQGCYGYCRADESCKTGFNIRQRKGKESACLGASISAASLDVEHVEGVTKQPQHSTLSKYFKRKRKLDEKRKCQEFMYSQKRKDSKKIGYQANVVHREKVKRSSVERSKLKYQENVVHREKVKRSSVERSKLKYQENVVHREKVKRSSVERSKLKYQENLVHREKVKRSNLERSKLKYQENLVHREKVKRSNLERSKLKYQENLVHREKVKRSSVERSKLKYQENLVHREKVKRSSVERSKLKYQENLVHREKVKRSSVERSKLKYQENLVHREKVKRSNLERIKFKYQSNVTVQEKVKRSSKLKYRENVLHRERVKRISKHKYRLDKLHRQRVKAMSIRKYHGNAEHRESVAAGNRVRRQNQKEKAKQFDFVMGQFLKKVEDGPDFVCCVCHRLLFKHQVLSCRKEDYNKQRGVALIADKCLSEDYLHKCSPDCEVTCKLLDSPRGQMWICYTCHVKINKGEVPPESAVNNLGLNPIPPELACLNSLEQHLIALHIPFMKMLALPKGGQNGVHGPVTCVPANIVQTDNLLPRSNMEGSLLRVKLKRKLTYKGHYEYQFVDTMKVRKALVYLKRTNVLYEDVEFNEQWLNEFCREEEEVLAEVSVPNVESSDAATDEAEDEQLHDRQQHCMFQDTCLMPVDLGQEALDQYFDDTLNLAPAEGNSPVRLLCDEANEAKSFPVLFPQGGNTFHESRQHRLTLSRYLNNRILHADGRFARNVEYIFFAQYMSELEQVVSKVSIALRKGKGGHQSQRVGEDLLRDEESLKQLLEFDDGFRFLKPIRGTPAFWQGAQKDLLACVRQLGVPTWFCSFSSADMRWKNLLNSILKQEGRTQTFEELEWADRCELLRRNPVTAARSFDFRWHCFLREVLMSPAEPIGKIKDYFHRVEFQQRGSPHIHSLFWIENAPKIDKDSDEEVVAFIDKYVTCELPSEDEELLDIVKSVQQHSKRHSKTCKKNKTVCRFNFPRPASGRTFIARGKSLEDLKKCKCQVEKTGSSAVCTCKSQVDKDSEKRMRDHAAKILEAVKKALSDENRSFGCLDELFDSLGITQRAFERAYKLFSRNTHVVLKREVNEVWVNQFSKPLLKCWNANMDIQYVVDAYACVVYIVSYISKAEREIGLLLGNAQREAAKDKNLSAKDALKNLGSVYLHNRDVSSQEAVYRLVPSMHLKECSRKVVFVPTGENVVKMSLPLNVLKQKAASSQGLTSEDMWMTSLVDRYRNRPDDSEFDDMCLATFASEYRVLSKNEKSQNRVKLKKDFGFVSKRTRSQPAVVRYARFSETKNPESFFQSILQLFLPHRVDVQLKPPNSETFEDFYMNGHVRFSDRSRHSVKSVVDLNRSRFEMEADKLDDIQHEVDSNVVLEDAWCELCPEQELERLQCLQEQNEAEQVVEEHVENIPDLAVSSKDVSRVEKRSNVLSRSDGLALVRSLNETQLSVFYQIRQWCLDRVDGKKPGPLHVFVTGGAGTGKSHLIRAIQYEAMRLLSPACRHPDNTCVLLTAPTGIAAYNLHAATIHSTFSIGVDVRLPYTPLGEEKINSLRAKLCDLQILIIDEISMVDHRLLAYIHGRLRQIKQTGDFAPFGNVSVIAVGDFFQLPPVKGKPLYVDDQGVNLWSSLFKVVELTTVVRQQDSVFAELLNRVRTRSKETPMLLSDIRTLQRCETGEVSSALHIFPTNRQVNEHNIQELFRTCPEYVEIEAQDYVNSKKTGKLELISGHHSRTYNTSLEETLPLGIDARVMLCKNVDVLDGLVNGVCGIVTHIVPASEGRFPKKVFVKFDDHQVGAQRRKQSVGVSSDLVGSTGIDPEEERVTNKGGLRRQFPLKLAWACTVHKVQGLTVDSAVVCLKRVFTAGQAYVALSRVRSLSGLIIQDFREKVIYCKDDIKDAVKSMPPFLIDVIPQHTSNTPTFSVFLMNVQSLSLHVSDLALCTQHLQPNCIAVTETWLPTDSVFENVKIDGYSFQNCPRSEAYTSNHPALVSLQAQQHGGVGMFSADNVAFDIIKVPHVNLECLVYKFVGFNILVAVIYRPPSYPMCLFKVNLSKLLDWLNPQGNTIAVMGDFNDDILKSSSICSFVAERGFVQLVTQPTTERGTLIDHVYVKTTQYEVQSVVWPTYFSDHEGILCCFNSKCVESDEVE